MNALALKQHIFTSYGGGADKRVKDASKVRTFIIDDRGRGDLNARKQLYPVFCMVFASLTGDGTLDVTLRGNVPVSPAIHDWVTANNAIYTEALQPSLTFPVRVDAPARLDALADLIEAIVKPGAPRYTTPSYKYACPRTAATLRKFSKVLKDFARAQQLGR